MKAPKEPAYYGISQRPERAPRHSALAIVYLSCLLFRKPRLGLSIPAAILEHLAAVLPCAGLPLAAYSPAGHGMQLCKNALGLKPQ